MRKLLMMSVAVVGGLVAVSTASAVQVFQGHGTLCAPLTPAHASNLNFSKFGVRNVSTTSSAIVGCSIPVTSNNLVLTTIDAASLVLYDRHDTQNVSCVLELQNFTGAAVWSGTQASSGFSSSEALLQWDPPATNVTSVYIECTLPPKTTFGESHITTFNAQKN